MDQFTSHYAIEVEEQYDILRVDVQVACIIRLLKVLVGLNQIARVETVWEGESQVMHCKAVSAIARTLTVRGHGQGAASLEIWRL
jgi:hypothetical protein